MKQLIDSATIANFTKGKVKAFNLIFMIYYPVLVRFAANLIKDGEEAKDITTEIFLKLWKMHANFDSENNIKAFLYVSVRNACLNFLDAQRRREINLDNFRKVVEAEELQADNKYLELESDILIQLRKEVEKLPNKCKAVFKYKFYDGLETEEIAQRLKISKGTVHTQISRAFKLLKDRLLKDKLHNLFVFLLLLEAQSENISEKSYHPFVDSATQDCFYIRKPNKLNEPNLPIYDNAGTIRQYCTVNS
jgi:RNA polymerase sigma-70 factor (ECF subfamily)